MQSVNGILVFGLCCLTVGCMTAPMSMEKHQIEVTVIYADSDSINLAAKARGYAQPTHVRGFYDPARNEIWCPNEETDSALRTCGHELRHRIKGAFHPH